MNIDQLNTLEILQRINEEDQKVALVVAKALPNIAQAVQQITQGIRNGGRLIYIGAGTSGRLGILDAVECVPTYGVPQDLVIGLIAGGERAVIHAVEGAEDDYALGRNDLEAIDFSPRDTLVGIAASGRTPYVLGAVEYAKSLGAATIGISCNEPAPLLDAVDTPIPVPVGPEVITGSTRMKAGTAQKMVLNMLSTGSMIQLGKVYGNLMVDVQASNKKLVNRAKSIVSQVAGVDDEQAETLLEQANLDVKAAIVMAKRDVSYDEARVLIANNNGRLREVIG